MENKYHVGIDLAEDRRKWLQRLLGWLGFKKYKMDMSCAVYFEILPDGTYKTVDCKYF